MSASPPRIPAPLIVILAGVLVAVGIAAIVGVPADDAAVLLSLTSLASIALACSGQIVLRLMAPRSLRTQALVVSVTAAAVVIAGILVAAAAMFISAHDRNVLLVVVALAASTSIASALQLANSFRVDAAEVERLTRRIGDPDDRHEPAGPLQIKEMASLAEQLQNAHARLEESLARERAVESSRRELVAWISHDLRSPLASIRALAEALEDRIVDAPDDIERYQRSIRLESERLSLLVDDLFELSRLHARAVRADADPIAVNELVADAVAGIGAAAEIKGVRIDVDLDSAEHALVPAADVLRIVRNLLDNAVRHTPSGGTVTMRVSAEDGIVALAVIDECGGIPERDMARVFDVAFRGDAARRRDSSSGGLGLTIAKGLAEAHAGSIDVCNLDRGCRFEVHIPVVGPDEPSAQDEDQFARGGRGSASGAIDSASGPAGRSVRA